MTVVEHLEELRRRIFFALLAVVVGAVVAYAIYDPILRLLITPLESAFEKLRLERPDVFCRGVTGCFLVRLKVSAFAGLFLALPVVLFQIWRFITPGLEPSEKRYAVPFVAASVVLFSLGVWFAFTVLPAALRFLLGFAGGELQPLITFEDYLGFLMWMILAFGLTFEFPLVLVFLGAAGVIDSSQLRRQRRVAILAVFITAAVATPSQDPVTQLMMAVPLYLLYELSILVVRFVVER